MNDKLLAAIILIVSTPILAAPCADGSGPESAVASYLSALQNHQFAEAFPHVTEEMTDGKSVDEWAALQKLFYQAGGVNIFGMDIRAAQMVDGESNCEQQAHVPNVLKSRDKFNNQGTTEFEVYLTTNDGSGWRVHEQETLFDQEAVDRWFPGEKMPEFRDQY